MESNTDYEQALDIINKMDDEGIKGDAVRMQNTDIKVEETLWKYVTNIFKHVDEDYSFKKHIQELLRDRIEGTNDIDTIIRLYTSLNRHEVASVQTSLAPFEAGKNQEGSPLLDNVKQIAVSLEDNMHNESDAEMLKAFDQLSKLLAAPGNND